MKKFIIPLLVIIFSGILAFSIYKIISANIEMAENQKQFEQLSSEIKESAEGNVQTDSVIIETDIPEIISTKSETIPEKINQNEERFKELIDKNKDFVGWLCIDGSKINYPVMRREDDPEYYLDKDFDGNPSVSGTLFMGVGCDIHSDNIMIHGHNMKNGSMFAGLLYYKDEKYLKNHALVKFDTIEKNGEYDIFAVFPERVHYVNEESVFRYYNYGGRLDKEQYDEFISECKKISLFDTGITPEYGQQLITLSTCAYHVENGRFVVVAVRRDD